MIGHQKAIRSFLYLWLLIILLIAAGCSPNRSYSSKEEASYRPPTLVPTSVPTVPTPTRSPKTTLEAECSNVLRYLKDVTIPDGTKVTPGSTLDKRWRVENSGTCNWSEGYTLRFIEGSEMGANPTQALYPALSGNNADLRIVFTAPANTGMYQSKWQAFDPDGNPFGDPIYVEIEVVSQLDENSNTEETNP